MCVSLNVNSACIIDKLCYILQIVVMSKYYIVKRTVFNNKGISFPIFTQLFSENHIGRGGGGTKIVLLVLAAILLLELVKSVTI